MRPLIMLHRLQLVGMCALGGVVAGNGEMPTGTPKVPPPPLPDPLDFNGALQAARAALERPGVSIDDALADASLVLAGDQPLVPLEHVPDASIAEGYLSEGEARVILHHAVSTAGWTESSGGSVRSLAFGSPLPDYLAELAVRLEPILEAKPTRCELYACEVGHGADLARAVSDGKTSTAPSPVSSRTVLVTVRGSARVELEDDADAIDLQPRSILRLDRTLAQSARRVVAKDERHLSVCFRCA